MGSLFCFIYIHMKDIEIKEDLRIIVNDFYSKARKDYELLGINSLWKYNL